MVWCEMRPTCERARAPPGSGIPASRALPDEGLSRPASKRRRVVFPAPFGPKTARQSPGASENVIPATACLDPKARVRSAVSTIGAPVDESVDGDGGFIRLELATLARAAQKTLYPCDSA